MHSTNSLAQCDRGGAVQGSGESPGPGGHIQVLVPALPLATEVCASFLAHLGLGFPSPQMKPLNPMASQSGW